MRVRFTEAALVDFVAQVDWLARRSLQAAWRARDRILATLAWLAEFPRASPLIDGTHRDAAVRFGRDGFFLRYRLDGDVLLVVAVYHGRQSR